MKNNSVGLATICVLITLFLCIVSTTVSLYIGIQDKIKNMFPFEVNIEISNKLNEFAEEQSTSKFKPSAEEIISKKENLMNEALETAETVQKEYPDVKLENAYKSDFTVCGFEINGNKLIEASDSTAAKSVMMVFFQIQDQFNESEGKNVSLKDDEILIGTSKDKNIESSNFYIYNQEYKIKGNVENKHKETMILDEMLIVVKDNEVLKKIINDTNYANTIKSFKFNLKGDSEAKSAFAAELNKKINAIKLPADSIKDQYFLNQITVTLLDSYTTEKLQNVVYGGFIFISSFVSILLLAGTALIMYYKQTAEGQADKEKFKIMKNIGISKEEIKEMMKGQMSVMCFLPLIIALIHVCVAFNPVSKILKLQGLGNMKIFFSTDIIITAVFVLIYFIIYKLTSKSYYKIISE